MKTFVTVATAFVATSALLVGCGGGGSDVAPTAAPSAAAPAIQLAASPSENTATPSIATAVAPASEAVASATVADPVATAASPAGGSSTVVGTASPVSPPASPLASSPPSASAAVIAPAASTATATAPAVAVAAVVPPSELTVTEYKASRNPSAVVATDPLPSAAALATLAAANRRMAVAQLSAQLTPGSSGNPAVVPPLTYSAFRTLTAASRGDTLAQLKSSGFDTAPVQYVAALQTNRVTSQLWADLGRRFTPEFLAATDTTGPWPRLAAWSASETSFADGRFASDATLISALAQVDPSLNPGALPGPTNNIRLVTANTVTEKASWAAVTPFDGIFDGGKNKHDLLQMPMVKVTAGVKRFAGTDFTADAMPMAGGLQLISLRPNASALTTPLSTYSSTRLEAALSEAIQGLLAVGAKPVAGEMILPKVDINLEIDPKGPLVRAGISLPFDEVNANFRNLDNQGGVYARPVFSSASLRVGNDGLTVKAADATAFTFSPLNIFGPTTDGVISTMVDLGFGGINATFGLFTCTWPTPDLRTFFLVVLDAQGGVVSIAAIQTPPGNEVKPTRTAYNPWAANLDNWTFPGDMKGVYPITRGLIFQGQAGSPALPPLVDVANQAGQFGFVENPLYTYSHQTCVK